MEYKFLLKWIIKVNENPLIIRELRTFRDQFSILFKHSDKYLQINLASENPFCFFSEKKILPFQCNKETERWNQHLNHASLQNISIRKNDRIILLAFSKTDIYNTKQEMTLILELIPHYQNMILVDKTAKILAAKRIFSFADNPVRQILPGQEYQFPPVHSQPADQDVHFPIAVKSSGKIEENSAAADSFNTVNSLLENLYYEHLFAKKIEQKRNQLLSLVLKDKKKKSKKIEKLNIELQDAEKMKKWKHYAELIKANLGSIKTGAKEITAIDYYQPDLRTVIIPLQEQFSPLENMNRYFKKYRKARDGKEKIKEQIRRTEDEVEVLSKQEFDILEADWQEFFSDFSEDKKKKEQVKRYKSLTLHDDWEIFIGRTSQENDFLTTKFAKPHDLWFHTRIFRGTHVILRNYKKQSVSARFILLCARLAAYYSKAKFSENVPVDYTEIRYVRKPRGSVPGYVTYTNQKTLFVNPLNMRNAREVLEKL